MSGGCEVRKAPLPLACPLVQLFVVWVNFSDVGDRKTYASIFSSDALIPSLFFPVSRRPLVGLERADALPCPCKPEASTPV
jgi:hypothetical protein